MTEIVLSTTTQAYFDTRFDWMTGLLFLMTVVLVIDLVRKFYHVEKRYS